MFDKFTKEALKSIKQSAITPLLIRSALWVAPILAAVLGFISWADLVIETFS